MLIKICHVFKDHTREKIENILKQKEKQISFKLNIENIENCPYGDDTEINLKKVDPSKAKEAEK